MTNPTAEMRIDILRNRVAELEAALIKASDWCPLCSGAGSYPSGKFTGNPHQEPCEQCADIRAALNPAQEVK